MELIQVSYRVWYSMYEEERDRPILGYVRGDRWSLAVDAGHSDAHVKGFYEALEKEGLPLPSVTVLTHWHWDHTFGMHAIHGLSIANKVTSRYLRDAAERIRTEGTDWFFAIGDSTCKEYADGRPVIVTPPDMEYEGEMILDLGNVLVRIFQAESPHTDDSTLVHVPGEKVLFVGDAVCGEFPSWNVDPDRMRSLIQTIENTDADYCLNGHWISQTKQEVLQDMRESMG